MSQSQAQAAYRFSLQLLSQLVSSGVRHLVASPGFRNSPLLLAAHKTPGLDVLSAVEERGAAFLALGLARSAEAPAALLCTSGTAVGNYLPAVMEASHAQIPLVVLTADRPQELVGSGANQCADQAKIFGEHVRHFADSAPPSDAPHENQFAGYLAARAVARARGPRPGPVHVNLRFREPFLPAAADCAPVEEEARATPWALLSSVAGPSEQQAQAIGALLRAAARPLITLGPGGLSASRLELLCGLSARTGIPVLAEAASGLAFARGSSRARVALRAEAVLEAFLSGALPAPDLLIRVGSPLTGRQHPQLLKASQAPQLVFEEFGETREPSLHPSVIVEGGLDAWLACRTAWNEAKPDREWALGIDAWDRKVEEKLLAHLQEATTLTEWHFHRKLETVLGEDANIFLGNSMPIRDFNSVFPRTEKPLRVFSNRGLSGIDGLIATATGVALASGRETHALLGDLSALHDLPSLALASAFRDRLRLTFWVLNNQGGEIFRIVQTARTAGEASWFTTPQEYDLSALAKAFRLPFDRVAATADLSAFAAGLFSQPGVRLIEVLVNREQNLLIRKSFRHGA